MTAVGTSETRGAEVRLREAIRTSRAGGRMADFDPQETCGALKSDCPDIHNGQGTWYLTGGNWFTS